MPTPISFRMVGGAIAAITFCWTTAASAQRVQAVLDPVLIGFDTQVGTHPNAPSMSSLWRSNAAPSLSTDGKSTWLNAPGTNGGVHIQGHGQDFVFVSGASGEMTTYRLLNAQAGVNAYGGNSTAVFGQSAGIGVYGQTGNSFGVMGEATANGWGGYFSGSIGVFSYGTGYSLYGYGNAYVVGGLEITGDAAKPGGGPWSATSDRRVKTDVVAFAPGLSAIEKVDPVWYTYNGLAGTEKSGKRYVGVVAQDLEKVAPFMISSQKKKLRETDSELTDIKQVDPNAFTFMLINAVKDLSGSVKDLKAQNAQMKRIICLDHPEQEMCSTKIASARMR